MRAQAAPKALPLPPPWVREMETPPSAGGASSPPEPTPHAGSEAEPASFACPDCGVVKASFKALSSHRSRVHGTRARAAPAVFGTVCLTCMKQFHVKSRLVNHLLHASPDCFVRATAHLDPAPPEIPEQLCVAETAVRQRRLRAGGRVTEFDVPSFRIPGPLPQWAAAPSMPKA